MTLRDAKVRVNHLLGVRIDYTVLHYHVLRRDDVSDKEDSYEEYYQNLILILKLQIQKGLSFYQSFIEAIYK